MGMAKHVSSGYGSSVFQGPLTTCDNNPVMRLLIMKTSSGTICRHQAGLHTMLSLPQSTVSPPFAFLHFISEPECLFCKEGLTQTPPTPFSIVSNPGNVQANHSIIKNCIFVTFVVHVFREQ